MLEHPVFGGAMWMQYKCKLDQNEVQFSSIKIKYCNIHYYSQFFVVGLDRSDLELMGFGCTGTSQKKAWQPLPSFLPVSFGIKINFICTHTHKLTFYNLYSSTVSHSKFCKFGQNSEMFPFFKKKKFFLLN